jgi:uncharacterized protein with FMN-binding domain
MLISLILAWVAAILCLLTALKYLARRSGNRALNQAFRKIHIPLGVALLVAGGLHGILAGNPSFATLTDFSLAPVLFTLNWGTACLVLSILLGLTYLLRKTLKRRWMILHRIVTVALLACLVIHVLDVGLQLPGRLFPAAKDETPSQQTEEVNEPTSPSTEDQTTTDDSAAAPEEQQPEEPVVTFSGAQLQDGTYEGSAGGYNGTITVSVEVSGGQVTAITVLVTSDTDRFFSQAKYVLSDIVDQQSLEVDAVSGATYSSAGLINATYDALSGAVVSGTLQVTQIDLSSVGRH